MKRLLIAFVGLMVSASFALADPSGLWSRSNDQGETHIRIAPNGKLYTGTIEWMENPRNDTQNPNVDLHSTSLVGAQIFGDMEQKNSKKWVGSLYNPEDGKTYSGSLEIVGANTLKLQGCFLVIFCKSDTWKRKN